MMPPEMDNNFRSILAFLGSKPTLDRNDLDFLEAFGRELVRVTERIRARGPKPPDSASSDPTSGDANG
jgi:hypothetical protein